MNFIKILEHQIQKNKLSHAYLVFGDFSILEVQKILKISQADLILIEERPIKIQKMRELIYWVNLKPHSSPKKIAVIKTIEGLTLEAANAILKVLEEPPENTIFILQASRKERILPTILSRCQIIKGTSRQDEDLPDNFLKASQILSKTIKDRFIYASEISGSENIKAYIDAWEREYREKLIKNEEILPTLINLRNARSLLSSNISVKLLLENLFLEF